MCEALVGVASIHIEHGPTKVKNVNMVGKSPTVTSEFKRGISYAYEYAGWVYSAIGFKQSEVPKPNMSNWLLHRL